MQPQEQSDGESRTPVVTLSPDGTTDFPNASETASRPQMVVPDEPIHWQATESIHHERTTLWFVIFALVVLGFIALAIFLMKSIFFAILVPVMAAAVIVNVFKPPRVLDYTLSAKGLYINDRLYPLSDYKSFAIIRDTGEFSVLLIPVKRFRPGVTVYFPESAGEKIVDMLGSRLPMEKHSLDMIDRLVRLLRI